MRPSDSTSMPMTLLGSAGKNQKNQLIMDAPACGSPKGLRIHFNEYEEVVQTDHIQKATRSAIICAAVSSLYALPSALSSAIKHCPQVSLASSDSNVTCGTSAAAIVGAVFGIVGVALTIHSFYLARENIRKFIDKRDEELNLRFRPIFMGDSTGSGSQKLMSRYSSLSKSERDQVRNDLFDIYLSNKKPIHVDLPTGQADLEVAADA